MSAAAPPPVAPSPPRNSKGTSTGYSLIAVIAGRECLAYQCVGCSACVEHCPVPGALVLVQGLAQIGPI